MPSRYTPTKPTSRPIINQSHPLARGLAFAAIFNEGAGLPADVVTGNRSSVFPNAWTPTPVGPGVTSPSVGTTGVCNFGTSTIWNVGTGPWTLAVYANPAASSTLVPPLFSRRNASTFVGFGLYGNDKQGSVLSGWWTLQHLSPAYNVNFGYQSANSGMDGNFHLYAGTMAGNGLAGQLFLDGVQQTMLQSFAGTQNYTGADTLYVGGDPTINAVSFTTGYAYLWFRQLNANEMMQLYQRPFAMFVQRQPLALSSPPLIQPPPAQRPGQSQNYFELPDVSTWYAANYAQPKWAPLYVATPPPPRQQSQYYDVTTPPPSEAWLQQYRRVYLTTGQGPVIQGPPTRQPSQYYDVRTPRPDESWLQQYRRIAISTSQGPVVQGPSPRQPSQDYYPIPDPWYGQEGFQNQKKPIPLQTTFWTSEVGVSGIYNVIFLVSQAGYSRVANDIQGYVVFVGAGILPDLTMPPAVYSKTLPITIPLTPPVSGLLTYYVLTRFRDVYGLESQNQFYSDFTIDHTGRLILPPVATPTLLMLRQHEQGEISIAAMYAEALVDPYPATGWLIWYGLTPPNTSLPPQASRPVTGKVLSYTTLPNPPGLYYVVVELYRGADGFTTGPLSGTVTVNVPPGEPVAVPSGFQGPPPP
jgi:hypothetical protein